MSVTYNYANNVKVTFKEKLTEEQKEAFMEELGPESEGATFDEGKSIITFSDDDHSITITLKRWSGSPYYGSLCYTLKGISQDFKLHPLDGEFTYKEEYESLLPITVTIKNGNITWTNPYWWAN